MQLATPMKGSMSCTSAFHEPLLSTWSDQRKSATCQSALHGYIHRYLQELPQVCKDKLTTLHTQHQATGANAAVQVQAG